MCYAAARRVSPLPGSAVSPPAPVVHIINQPSWSLFSGWQPLLRPLSQRSQWSRQLSEQCNATCLWYVRSHHWKPLGTHTDCYSLPPAHVDQISAQTWACCDATKVQSISKRSRISDLWLKWVPSAVQRRSKLNKTCVITENSSLRLSVRNSSLQDLLKTEANASTWESF